MLLRYYVDVMHIINKYVLALISLVKKYIYNYIYGIVLYFKRFKKYEPSRRGTPDRCEALGQLCIENLHGGMERIEIKNG